MRVVFRHLGVFLLWNIVLGSAVLFLPPELGLPAALLLAALLIWGYLLRAERGGSRSRRLAELRLRPLHGAPLYWSFAAIPVLLLLSWSLGEVYLRFVSVPPESLDPFAPILANRGGRLTITVLAVLVAPMVEEFVFRGLIQSRLERSRGPIWGICIGAALFALVHFLPWVFPLHFILGLVFGFAVYATGSIWTGVLLHAANNSAAMLGQLAGTPEAPVPTVWEVGMTPATWSALLLLLLVALLTLWTGRKLLEAGRRARLRLP